MKQKQSLNKRIFTNLCLIIFAAALITACVDQGSGEFKIEPVPVDGIFFIADKEQYQSNQLYVTEAGETEPRQISSLPYSSFDTSVYEFKLSPDRKWVAFGLIASNGGARSELYIVPAMGGEPILIAGDILGDKASINAFEWSPDSQKLAYRTYHYSEGQILYTVNPDGTANTRISGNINPAIISLGGGAGHFKWSPAGKYLAYTAALNEASKYDLYRALPDGTDQLRLSQPFTGFKIGVNWFEWSPDGSRLAFVADYFTLYELDLYIVNMDGSQHTKVVDNTVYPSPQDFKWSPDSLHLSYKSNQLGVLPELYTVQPDGTNHKRVSTASSDTQGVDTYEWSPDSGHLAYVFEEPLNAINELYVVTPDGTLNYVVSETTGTEYVSAFTWSPDGTKIMYKSAQATNGIFELFTVNANSTNLVKVIGSTIVSKEGIGTFSWSPDSSRLGIRILRADDTIMRLYTVNPDGSQLAEVSGALVTNGSVVDFKWSTDSKKIAYVADQDIDGISMLYSTSFDTENSVKVSGDVFNGLSVKSFIFVN